MNRSLVQRRGLREVVRRALGRIGSEERGRRRGGAGAVERLERRLALAIDFTIASWTEQGPGPIENGQVEGLGAQNNPVAGAVEALAAHPTDADILFAGTVNGGIWRTTNATDASPDWQPLTDQFASLSIAAIAFSPLDPTNQTLFAATGDWRSGSSVVGGTAGDGAIGLLRSTDGGDSWSVIAAAQLAGFRLRSIVPTSLVDPGTNLPVVLAAGEDGGGVWRSVDGGDSFTQISGQPATTDGIDNDGDGATDEADELNLPAGNASHLAADPTNSQRFYASLPGTGVHRSDDGGATWRLVNGSGPNSLGFLPAQRIETSVSAGGGAVYAQIINIGQLSGLYRSTDQGANWTQIDTPQTIEGGQPFGLQPREHPGAQGRIHASILADDGNNSVVYLGGDRQPRTGPDGQEGTADDAWPNSIGANNFSGRLFRVDASLAPGSQSAPITNNFANGTSPHADSRDMVYDANGDIVEADDGGIYRLRNPNTPGQFWESVNGNLRPTEFYSVAYDTLNDVVIGGTQDAGSPEQQNPGDFTWSEPQQGDGFIVEVGQSGGQSIRYLTSQNLGTFSRRVFDNTNTLQSSTQIPLNVLGTGGGTSPLRRLDTLAFLQPYAINALDPFRMVIGTTFLYESSNGGDSLTALGGQTGIDNVNNDADANVDEADEVTLLNPVGQVRAFAYGGRIGGDDFPDVLYVGTDGGTVNGSFGRLFLRTQTTAGDLTDFAMLTTYPGANVIDVALDPADYRQAFVLDVNGSVWRTTDAGATAGGWSNLTGGLPSSNFISDLTTVAFVPGAGSPDVVVVGGLGGVAKTPLDLPSTGVWTEVGANLPNMRAFDLRYDVTDDLLLAGTIGRGAWTLANASTALEDDNVLTVCGDEQFVNQDDVVRLRLDPNNPALLQVFLNNDDDDSPDLVVPLGAVGQINVFGVGGNDQLVIDTTSGLITVPLGIRYNGDGACPGGPPNGGADRGFDRLTFVQDGGPTHASSRYAVGPEIGSGVYTFVGAGLQTVYFEELEPIVDTVPTVLHTVVATPEQNAINYGLGPNSGIVNLFNPSGAITALITVDAYESVELAAKTNLAIEAGAGADQIHLNHPGTPTGLVNLSVDGGDPTTDDRLIVNDADSSTPLLFTPTAASAATIAGAQTVPVALTNVEHVVLNGLDGGDSLTIVGTPLDDSLTVRPTGEGAGEFRSSGSPALDFLSIADVTIDGGAGGVDLVRIEGTPHDDAVASTASAVILGGTTTIGAGVERVIVDGLAGADLLDLSAFTAAPLELIGGDGDDELRGGALNDVLQGGRGRDVLIGGAGADRIYGDEDADRIEVQLGGDADSIEGGDGDDIVNVSDPAAATFSVAGLASGAVVRILGGSGIADLTDVERVGLIPSASAPDVRIGDLTGSTVRELAVGMRILPGGFDSFSVSGEVRIDGSVFDDSIVVTNEDLSFGVVVPVVAMRWGRIFLSDLPPVPVSYSRLTIDGRQGNDTIRIDSDAPLGTTPVELRGGDGDDVLLGGSTVDRLVGGPGHDILAGGGGGDTFDGGTGFDTILIEGTPDADAIFLDQTSSVALAVRINGVDDFDSLVAGTVEQAEIRAGQGADSIAVRIADSLVADPLRSLRVVVRGGEPTAGDRLSVIDDGLGDLSILREARDGASGSLVVGPLAPVVYENVEFVDLLPLDPVTGGAGADGLGRLLVVDADPFESNNSRLNPTPLDPTCFTTAQPEPGGICTLPDGPVGPNVSPAAAALTAPGGAPIALPGDEDWYLFRAPKVGAFRFDLFFETITTLSNGRPGLPGDGALAIDVYDDAGTLIVSGSPLSGEAFRRGLQATFSADADDSYFLRVRGATPNVDNIYDLQLVEVDLLGPRAAEVFITAAPAYDLFDPKPSVDGPTPRVDSLTIRFEDLLTRALELRAPGDVYPALDALIAAEPGHYRLVGDANGVIPIERIVVTNDPVVAGQLATGSVELFFTRPLPDDRFTLTVFDTLLDPAGNRLDGESNTIEPQETAALPSGDGTAGGAFTARFTVDSRAELGVFSSGSVYVDTNGNFTFDPTNVDFTHRDITYLMGFTSDNLFAGNFVQAPGGSADGFDKLAAYGKVGTSFRWLIDVDNDGVVDLNVTQPTFPGTTNVNGMPAAGDFDGVAANGDETALKVGSVWLLDTNHDFRVDTRLPGANMPGHPIVGDFDGDGADDLGSWTADRFYFNLSSLGAIDGATDVSFAFGFAGVRERPYAGDFDVDGVDDFGLWVPDRSGAAPSESAEWYVLVSDGRTLVERLADGGGAIFYTPTPFGADFYAQFGDEFGLPVAGNFDPPVTPLLTPDSRTNLWNPLDVDNDGVVAPLDALLVINRLNDDSTPAASPFARAPFLDVDGDGVYSPLDALLVINALNSAFNDLVAGEGESDKPAGSAVILVEPTTASDEYDWSSLAANVLAAAETPESEPSDEFFQSLAEDSEDDVLDWT